MMALAFLYFLIPLVSAASWKENTLISLSQTIATSESLRNCWICHFKFETISEDYVPFMVPVTDFSTVPEPITYYALPPPATTFKVRIAALPGKIQIPCLTLSEEITTAGKVTTGPPRSLDFIVKKCDKKNPLICKNGKCERAQDDTILCQRVRKVGRNVRELWEACSGRDPWLENVMSVLPQNEGINFDTMGGITCAPPGYYFVCGTGRDPKGEGWAHRCLDSWEMEGSCLLGYIRMPFALYSLESTSSLPKSNTHLKRMILAEYEGNKGQSVLGNLTLTARIYVNRDMTHNLSATIGQIAEDTAKSIAAQHTSLNSLTRVVLGNRIAQDFLLAKQGGVCVMANNTCCTYINTSGEVETQVNRILQKATWLQDVHKEDAHQDLFSWLPSEIGRLF